MPEYNKEFSEDLPYFSTAVQPLRSLGEVQAIMEDFGVEQVMVQTGQSKGTHAWLIRFVYSGQVYRFVFTPKKCRNPEKVMTYAGKRRTNSEQSVYQMGRTAVYFTKAMLMAADVDPDALFAFAELPNNKTVAELGFDGVIQIVKDMPLQLSATNVIEGEIVEE